MIHYVNNIAKFSTTYVHCIFKQIIDKQKDVWVAPQMAQLFLLFIYLFTAHTIAYKTFN